MEFRVYSIEMTSKFRGITRREGMLVRGAEGWAEWSPFLDYSPLECVPWWMGSRLAAERPWPEPVRDEVPVNVTIPAVGPDRAAALVRRSGCATAKVKVAEPGQSLDHDLDRVSAVREALGPGGAIRVDANGAWDLREAEDAIEKLNRAAGGLEYAEQPCATVDDLARLRRKLDVRIAADESIRRAADPFLVRDKEAADVAIIKVQPLGGMKESLRIAELLQMPVVVSSAVETSIGLAMGVAVAAALEELPFACGLGTTSLLKADVVADPLVPVNGKLTVRRPELDEEAFAAVAADQKTTDRWFERFDHVQQEFES